MNAAVLLEDLSQDYQLLAGLVDGIGAYQHRQLSRLLCNVLCCVTTHTQPSCSCSTTLDASRDVLASNVLAMLIAMERGKALRVQSNVHTFMRGNSLVPLLFDTLGREWLHPFMVAGIDSVLNTMREPDASSALECFLTDDSPDDIDGALERLDTLVSALWDVVVDSIPCWPLSFRWALASLSRRPPGLDGGRPFPTDYELVPMLSTIVMLRCVIPCIMGFSTRNVSEGDDTLLRKRIMFLTKLLQRAAYFVDDDVAHDDNEPGTSAAVVATIVDCLHRRMVGVWWYLLDDISVLDDLKKGNHWGTSPLVKTTRGTTTPLTGSPLLAEGTHCPYVMELLSFVDQHVTSIVGHMHSMTPISAPIHLHRLHNFSRFAKRRIDQIVTPEENGQLKHDDVPLQNQKATTQMGNIASSFQALKNKFSRSRSSSQASSAPPAVLPSSDPSKEEVFDELVRHSSRCRLQPETLNYAQLFCLLVGNVQTLVSKKDREEAESVSFSGTSMAPDVDPDSVACAMLALYADQLTESNQHFASEKERNTAVLQKSIPLASRHCQRLAPSILCEGALDAAAHLCYMLDVVQQSSGSCTSVQLLFFPPQEPLKCGCGKEWLRAVIQHLLPAKVTKRISQVVFSQPSAVSGGNTIFRSFGLTPSGRSVGAPTAQHVFAHDTNVALPWSSAGVERRVTGVKSHSVLASIERIVNGADVDETLSSLPSILMAAKSPPTTKVPRVPLTFRDYHFLKLEGAEQGTATPTTRSRRGSFTKGGGLASSTRSIPTEDRSHFPDELPSPPPGIKSPIFERGSPGRGSPGVDPATPSDASIRGPLLLREYSGDVWEPRLQRHILELVWSVASPPHRFHNATAVGIPRTVLRPFRVKVAEWFCRFHVDLVENLVSSSSSAAAQRLTSDRLRREFVPPSTSGLLRRQASFQGSSPPTRPSTTRGGSGRAFLPHCTWLGFLSERINPLDMAEFEAACYHAITEVYGSRTSDTGDSSSWLFVETGEKSSPQLALCSVSLQHITLRSLWRMLLYSVSRTWGTIASFELWDYWCSEMMNVVREWEPPGIELVDDVPNVLFKPERLHIFHKAVAERVVAITTQYGTCEHEMMVMLIQCTNFARNATEDISDAELGKGISQILSTFAPSCCDHTVALPAEFASSPQRSIDVVGRALAEFGEAALCRASGPNIAPLSSRSWLSGLPDDLLVAQVPL